jgi:hypothetical protein
VCEFVCVCVCARARACVCVRVCESCINPYDMHACMLTHTLRSCLGVCGPRGVVVGEAEGVPNLIAFM